MGGHPGEWQVCELGSMLTQGTWVVAGPRAAQRNHVSKHALAGTLEAQHAKLDTLIVEALSARCDARERAQAVEEYLEIGGILDEGLGQQVAFNLDAFERATGRKLTAAEREHATQVQRRANRFTYLGSGMTHPKFRAQIAALGPELADRVASVAPAFC